jgi:hypothetical protein
VQITVMLRLRQNRAQHLVPEACGDDGCRGLTEETPREGTFSWSQQAHVLFAVRAAQKGDTFARAVAAIDLPSYQSGKRRA